MFVMSWGSGYLGSLRENTIHKKLQLAIYALNSHASLALRDT
jgi:hypothetical protein